MLLEVFVVDAVVVAAAAVVVVRGEIVVDDVAEAVVELYHSQDGGDCRCRWQVHFVVTITTAHPIDLVVAMVAVVAVAGCLPVAEVVDVHLRVNSRDVQAVSVMVVVVMDVTTTLTVAVTVATPKSAGILRPTKPPAVVVPGGLDEELVVPVSAHSAAAAAAAAVVPQ